MPVIESCSDPRRDICPEATAIEGPSRATTWGSDGAWPPWAGANVEPEAGAGLPIVGVVDVDAEAGAAANDAPE